MQRKILEQSLGEGGERGKAEGLESAEVQMCWRAPECGCYTGCRQGVTEECKAELLYNAFVRKIAMEAVEHRLERKGTSGGRETISKDIVKSHAVKSEDPEQNRVGWNKEKNDSRKTLKVDLIGCQL